MSSVSFVQSPKTQAVDDRATALTRARYQRISSHYDRMQKMMERFFHPWRRKQWQLVSGERVLEVGVGTGKNIEFWPAGMKVTAIDLTPGMLEIARQKVALQNRNDDLRIGDVQSLEFASATFDTVVASFVFCSVPDPILGLREVARVVRPRGRIVLLEHVRLDWPVIGTIMDLLAPLIVRMEGANINRRTVENVRAAGLQVEKVEPMDRFGMVKLIVARPV